MNDAIASELARFRSRVRAWLAENAQCREAVSPPGHAADGQNGDSPQAVEAAKSFQAKLYDAGLAGLTWPEAYGGQGLTMAHERVFNEEAGGYLIPTGPLIISLGICAPTLLESGTEEQRLRHIPRMLRGDEVWCQLFCDPGTVGEPTHPRTRAVRDGDAWVINGQKIWTAGAHYSDYGLLFAHAGADVPNRRGLAKFIVDMRSPGVIVHSRRRTIDRTAVSEVLLENVRIPVGNLVGHVNAAGRP
jgi:alkylation response protein AidB-like acyl-CoA dehydrogenase